jgi:hypothetical protein
MIFWMILAMAPFAGSQNEEKIKKLFEDAIQAMGGDAYLGVADMISEGNYFTFNYQGDSSSLIKFSDYTKLPDKSRFELGNRKEDLEITVFNLSTNEGWIREGQRETREATMEEMQSFKNAVKHSIETIVRYRYKDPENKLFYLGPGEGRDVTLEMVKIVDPENDEVTVYFDRMSRLPAKVEYQSRSERGARLTNTQEFSQWHFIQGVKTPLRIDGYVNGRQSFQQFIIKITYNNNLPDDFFSKPVPDK